MGKPEALITFSIPYYSGKAYLKRAVESVQSQRDPRWKLVISEDLGPEPLFESDEFLQTPQIKVVKSDVPLGLVGNFNRCLELAETPLVCVLHGDDELEKHYTDRIIELAKEHPHVSIFYSRVNIIDSNGKYIFSFKDWIKNFFDPALRRPFVLQGEEGLCKLLFANFIFCPSMCFRTERAQSLKFSHEWMQVTDLELTTRALLQGDAIMGIPEQLFNYRRHSGSVTESGTRAGDRFEEENRFFQSLVPVCESKELKNAARVTRRRLIFRLHVLLSVLGDLLNLRLTEARRKVKLVFN